MNLKNYDEVKTTLITGGSRGIGKQIALEMSTAGYHVCLTYQNNSEQAQKVVEQIESHGGLAEALYMDQSQPSSITETIQKIVKKYERIDILVNNAAIAQEKDFEELTLEDWDHILNTNLRGAFLCSQAILPLMAKNRWGRIINISSVGGQWGGWRQVHYATSKAGLLNLTRSLARIYANRRITVNSIAPGLIVTEMTENELNSEQGRKKIEQLPLRRAGFPKDIAAAAVFLASESAAYITGQTVNINGGMYLK